MTNRELFRRLKALPDTHNIRATLGEGNTGEYVDLEIVDHLGEHMKGSISLVSILEDGTLEDQETTINDITVDPIQLLAILLQLQDIKDKQKKKRMDERLSRGKSGKMVAKI